MLKKILALLLVVLMVVPVMVSCGDKTEKPGNSIDYNTEAKGDADADEEEDPLIAEIDDHVSELATNYNFKGKTFTWIGPDGWEAPVEDEETGDVESDAMYFRQREIEDKFALAWVNNRAPTSGEGDTSSPTVDMIKQDVMAGTGAYDAAYAGNMHTQQLLINDCLMNLTDFTVMDLDREWWQQDLQGSLSIGGELYFLQGSILTSYYQDAMCVVFNKQVAEDYGVEGLYDIVKDGDWTYDKMFEIASAVPENTSGAGAYRYAGIDGIAIVISHGYSLTEFDDDGNPYLPDAISQDIVDMADKYSIIFSDDSQTINIKGRIGGNYENFEEKYGYEHESEMFEDGKMLFYMTDTSGGAYLRTLDVDFGFLPMPKGSDAQEDYISYSGGGNNVFVPKTSKDPQMLDVILEAMGALGYKYYKPTYYDNMLKSRTVKDFESKEMLDIIFASKKYDIIEVVDKGATISGAGEMVTFFNTVIEESSQGMVSKYFIKSKIVNSSIKGILANIQSDIKG